MYVIAESDLNDTRLIRAPDVGGYGLDAQWSDDFHHALQVLLTGERTGYYQDFGRLQHLAKAWREGFVYSGEYSAYRQRRHGNSSRHIPAQQLVVCTQNHDQAGNRMRGERLSQLVPFESCKLAAGAVLLSPFIPLLFMGEEYGETAPFLYFISHLDPDLVAAVQRGRRHEFASFRSQGEPPDPQAETTFLQARLDHTRRHTGHHLVLYDFYKALIQLRKALMPLAQLRKDSMEVLGYEPERVLFVRRWHAHEQVVLVFHFGLVPTSVALPLPPGHWHKRLDSAAERWQGSGSPVPVVLYSVGEVLLTLSPTMFVLLEWTDDVKGGPA
jgi:maltooligosyltrehalose trehalohydrolase